MRPLVGRLQSLTARLCFFDLFCFGVGLGLAWNGHNPFADPSSRFLIHGDNAFLWSYVVLAFLCTAWSIRVGLRIAGFDWLVGIHLLLLGAFVYRCTTVSDSMRGEWLVLAGPLTLVAVALSCVILVWSVAHRAELAYLPERAARDARIRRRLGPPQWPRFLPDKNEAKAFDANLLPMADWRLVEQKPMSASWRDRAGDAVTLTRGSAGLVTESLSDERSLQRYCRRFAESQGAGLVEVEAATSAEGPCLKYIYKRLEKHAFKFFGVVAIPVPQATWIWMIVTLERGDTGVREAVVTAKLFEAGRLTLESYKASWCQDPYDPSYAGVDKSTLRYISDSPEYDDHFPDHPLTKMRRELRRLIGIRISPPASN